MLHIAAFEGQFDVVAALTLVYKAPMHEADDKGMTALHHAFAAGHANIVGWLLERGASVHESDAEGGLRSTMRSLAGTRMWLLC